MKLLGLTFLVGSAPSVLCTNVPVCPREMRQPRLEGLRAATCILLGGDPYAANFYPWTFELLTCELDTQVVKACDTSSSTESYPVK